MKKNYTIFLLLIFYIAISNGQSNCSEAYPDLNYAYSHVKLAYNSNNITHLKYYSNKSEKAFERAKKILINCNCNNAYNYAYDGHKMLSKVKDVETYEDGRFYVKRGRDTAKESILELDECTKLSNNDNSLEALQQEKLILKQQQLELMRKEEEIKTKMAEQKRKELMLKKELLINSYETAISSNIKNFNSVLKNFECNYQFKKENISQNELIAKSIKEIKSYYLKSIKKTTSTYLAQLDICNN